MVYNADFVYASIVLIIVIIISYILKFRESTVKIHSKFFLGMCITHLFSSCFDVLMVHPAFHGQPYTKIMVTWASMIYFISRNALPYLYFIYIVSLVKGISGKVKHLKYILPLCGAYAAVLLSAFYPVIFQVDSGGYSRGKYIFILYVISFFYLLMGFLYLWFNRTVLKRLHRLALQYGFIGISALAVVMQILWPALMIESFGVAVCLLMIYLTIESPENIIDSETGTLNKGTFLYDMALALKNGYAVRMLSVTVTTQDLLMRTMGLQHVNGIKRCIAEEIKKICPSSRIYTISDHSLCIMFSGGGDEDSRIMYYTDAICRRFEKPFMVNTIENYVEAAFCFFRCPEDTKEVDNIIAYLSHVEGNGASAAEEKLVYAQDIDLDIEGRRQKVRGAVRKAIREDTFEVYYQPIYSTRDKKFISAEALLRLKDSELGPISPEEFIPEAEADGTILVIGDYVLEEVCRFIKEANLEAMGIRYVELNLSVIQCMNQDLPRKVMDNIRKYGLKPDLINLEITETAAADSPKMLRLNLEKLAREGISFSLDDYGTGYSTMNYIIQHPFKLIKLDKSIVCPAIQDERARIALESTVTMIQRLGLEIVAEGVETAEQAAYLEELGVEYLQGYYYSRPVPGKEFVECLRSSQKLYGSERQLI